MLPLKCTDRGAGAGTRQTVLWASVEAETIEKLLYLLGLVARERFMLPIPAVRNLRQSGDSVREIADRDCKVDRRVPPYNCPEVVIATFPFLSLVNFFAVSTYSSHVHAPLATAGG